MAPQKHCAACGEIFEKDSYSNTQFAKPDGRCRNCVEQKVEHRAKRQKRSEVQEQLKELEQKLDAKVAINKKQTDAKIAEIQQGRTRKGAQTQAQFYDGLLEANRLKNVNQNEIWSGIAEWPLERAPKEPAINALEHGENGVQSDVTTILNELIAHEQQSATINWTSLPDPDAYRKVSFRTRKPDVVNYQKDQTGCLAITSFGDLKRRGLGGFSSEETGHILDMARSFMEHVGMYTPFLIVFLSDGVRWQFFRVDRQQGDQLYYRQASVINDAALGWRYYVALLSASLAQVGHFQPAFEGVELKSVLGRGGSAVVYKGILDNEEVLVKVFDKTAESSYKAERWALKK